MTCKLPGLARLLLIVMTVCILAGAIAAEKVNLKHHEKSVVNLEDRLKKLTKNQVKLEIGLKTLARKSKEAEVVWSDRVNQLSSRLSKRIDSFDLHKASWSTIGALADIGFVFELNHSGANRSIPDLKSMLVEQHNELTHTTKKLEEQKRIVNQKVAKLLEMNEVLNKERETIDINTQLYKRKLRFLKFKHTLINSPSKKLISKIKKYMANEHNVKSAEHKLIEFLKSDSGYVTQQLEKRHKKINEMVNRLGLTPEKRQQIIKSGIKSGYNFHFQPDNSAQNHPKSTESLLLSLLNAKNPIITPANLTILQQPANSNTSHTPLVAIDNRQAIDHRDGSSSAGHANQAAVSPVQISGVRATNTDASPSVVGSPKINKTEKKRESTTDIKKNAEMKSINQQGRYQVNNHSGKKEQKPINF